MPGTGERLQLLCGRVTGRGVRSAAEAARDGHAARRRWRGVAGRLDRRLDARAHARVTSPTGIRRRVSSIAGDALGSRFAVRSVANVGAYSVDNDEVVRSVRKLAALEPDTICFGHGPEIVGSAAPVLWRGRSLPSSHSL